MCDGFERHVRGLCQSLMRLFKWRKGILTVIWSAERGVSGWDVGWGMGVGPGRGDGLCAYLLLVRVQHS